MTHIYETHRLEWNGITIEVRYCRNWLGQYKETYGYHLVHLEIEAIDPERARVLPRFCGHFKEA